VIADKHDAGYNVIVSNDGDCETATETYVVDHTVTVTETATATVTRFPTRG
jgi:hypothetical protein